MKICMQLERMWIVGYWLILLTRYVVAPVPVPYTHNKHYLRMYIYMPSKQCTTLLRCSFYLPTRGPFCTTTVTKYRPPGIRRAAFTCTYTSWCYGSCVRTGGGRMICTRILVSYFLTQSTLLWDHPEGWRVQGSSTMPGINTYFICTRYW